jgi:hypothetical protein
MQPQHLIIVLLAAVMSMPAAAISLTEISSHGQHVQLYVDGSKGRMDGGSDGYMLVNSQTNKLYLVAPDHDQALDMSSYLGKAAARPGAKTRFKPAGNGPTIAGYATKRYDYSVGGQLCGSVYTSKQALTVSGAKTLVQAMERIGARARAANDDAESCGRGRDNVVKVIASLGMPMRITDANGKVDSEVVKISTNVSPPAGGFELPAGIKVRDGAQIEAMAQKYAPQIDSMMQKAEESGQVSSETMDKLRRARDKYLR